MAGEQLVLVLHPETGQEINEALVKEVSERNRRLLNYKRISGYLAWDRDFPLTASLKIKRAELGRTNPPKSRPFRRGAAVIHLAISAPERSRP